MATYPKQFDVIVVGAGHAGIEAALAASRIGCETILLTSNLDTIGFMSCNPAIGGIGKGQLVREIDALGGEMGLAADETGLQFRMLNTNHGPAVWSPRAQCDKKFYHTRMKRILESQPNLSLLQATVEEVIVRGDSVVGVKSQTGMEYIGKAIVITTGTFLKGLIHIGVASIPGGRFGEPPATKLSDCLFKLGFEVGRLKTGTPPRINKNTVSLDSLARQEGDEIPRFFSFRTPKTFHVEQLPCYLTHTTETTKEIVRQNLNKSALFSGRISGIGPRYCPSIEDKIVKFPDKPKHQIFLEPEGRLTDEYYINGLSTSLPEDVQIKLVKSLPGLERAEIVRFAYAIEYDYVNPIHLRATLESKNITGLFLAGQINGTSGYEEAAGQGIIAGINAAMHAMNKPKIILNRSDAYIGVMIDDLITKGVSEPYRIFTASAEYRLQLRQDNADLRLTPIGREVGLVKSTQWTVFLEKKKAIETEITRLQSTYVGNRSLFTILQDPKISYGKFEFARADLPDDVKLEVEIQVKYQGYIQRELESVQRMKLLETKRIPPDLDYEEIKQLRVESRQKLSRFRPDTIGQASRIQGITPAEIAVLLIWLRKHGA